MKLRVDSHLNSPQEAYTGKELADSPRWTGTRQVALDVTIESEVQVSPRGPQSPLS